MVNDQNGCVTAVLLTIEHLRRANKGTLTVGTLLLQILPKPMSSIQKYWKTDVKYSKVLFTYDRYNKVSICSNC